MFFEDNEDENFPLHIFELKKQLRECWLNSKEIIEDFTANYLVPEDLWLDRSRGLNTDEVAELSLKAVYHFCYDLIDRNEDTYYHVRHLNQQCYYSSFDSWDNFETYHSYFGIKSKVEEGFKYPHKGLKLDLMSHERFCTSPIPKETFIQAEKMEELYEKIILAKTDDEKMEYILESKNIAFIKQYIEMKLCSDLNDKHLWKFYIKYLKEADPNEMLQVYSKYCRYFLDDDEMKEEYRSEVERLGGVIVPWKNPFDFESIERSESPVEYEEEDAIEGDDEEVKEDEGVEQNDEYLNEDNWCNEVSSFVNYDCKGLNGYYNCYGEFVYNLRDTKFQSIAKQQWPFKSPLMRYIMTADNSVAQRKLQQTCKSFFAKNPILYSYRFSLNHYSHSAKFIEASITCCFKNEPYYSKLKLKQFHIATVFELDGPYPKFDEVIKNNIYKCAAKYVKINNQPLTEKELLFLIGHGGVEDLRLKKCEIKKADNEAMKLEEILEHLPKLKIFSIEKDSLKTNNTLSKIKFHNKLFIFRIERLANELDPDDFCDFVRQNYAPGTKIRINFHYNVDHSRIRAAIKKMSKEWIPQSEKPYISCPQWDMEACNVT